MKPVKVCWYGLIVVLYFAGRITGRREFFLLLFIMGFILLYSLCLNLWTAGSFCYIQEVEKKVCVKGSSTSMRITIVNDKPFPFSLIRLTMVPVARSQAAYGRFSLLPGSRIAYSVPLHCPYRGIYGVGMTTLEINDSFGLVRTNFNMLKLPYYRHTDVKVYPQLTELSVLPAGVSDSKLFGNVSKWYTDHGESFADLRPYRPGDQFKRVHRAVSARMREWYVRTYDMPVETSILIALDTAMNCETVEDGLYLSDLACECAAAIARYSIKTGYRVVYHDTGLASPLVLRSLNDFTKLYDRLTALRFTQQGDDLEGFPHLSSTQLSEARAAYIISASGGERLKEALDSPDNTQPGVKLIAVGSKASSLPGIEPGFSGITGVQIVHIAVGDDVAEVLAL